MCAVELRNKAGTPVDPVPFVVAALTAFLVTHAWGPIYLSVFGLSVGSSYLLVTGLYLGITTALYYQLVWQYRPETRREVPVERRLWKLVYGIVIGIVIVLLLALPVAV